MAETIQNDLFTVTEDGALQYRYDGETLRIEAFGRGLRVRATKADKMPEEDWALIRNEQNKGRITLTEQSAEIENGKIRAQIDHVGRIQMFRIDGKMILSEYLRTRADIKKPYCSALEIDAREFKPLIGGDWALTLRLESLDRNEKIYGMGQYQQDILNIKGAELELAQRNSQASVPFFLSSLGYGFLWNNPAVGRATFGTNIMSFVAESSKKLDYWIVAGDTPAEIEEAYAEVTGKVPMMPEYAMGFWQCKLRYQTQEELLSVAREYKRRNLPVSVIVVDFFHWPLQGEWKFDPTYWPDPDAMIRELKEMGIELMVSIWPTVDYRSENFEEMKRKGYLIRTERGVRVSMTFQGNTIHFDATNPAAREYVWQKAKQNYYDKGVRIFWLDEAEPEYEVYQFDNYRYHIGSNLQIGNIYPAMYARAFYEGMQKEGQENILNLLRCAWAGSARYGALVWSGDIASTFEVLRRQLEAGLNMGIAGIPWWTTDIGGFHGGDPKDPAFQELLARWFEFGAYCPVMRLHGDRDPKQPQYGETGGATCLSGADNEVWSFGEEDYEICKKYLAVRETMRPYLREVMREAHEKGTPVMRPLFYDFPDDKTAWEIEDQYMFGPNKLIAPVLEAGKRAREVYLPCGARWKNIETGECFEGGQTITADAPLDVIPVFEKL
ncbi:MAG: glycoside hydrolase family 31 protein [Clostridia bacterium]|nr:glycoside hydrolase family 31 protein [Clostridia bacterium]